MPKLQKISPLYNSHFLLSPRWPLWRGLTFLKNTLQVLILLSWTLICSLVNLRFLIFFFRQRREEKRITRICLEHEADFQMFKTSSNNRGVAEVNHGHRKEITSCQVGLWTIIVNTLSGYLLNFWKVFSSGNVCWHLAYENIRFSSLFTTGTFCMEDCLRLSDRNSILMTHINVYIINLLVMGFQI